MTGFFSLLVFISLTQVYGAIMDGLVCISAIKKWALYIYSHCALMLVYSGRTNVDEVIKFLMGKSASKLLFCWVICSNL